MAVVLGLAVLQGRGVNALAGGAVGFGLFLTIYYLARRGMGQGDVKLAGLLGLINGWPLILLAVLLSFISVGLVASVFLAMRSKGRKDPVPFGPFLVGGSLVAFLWGQTLWDAYLKLFH
jgi:leader peptidase (prepilin peptidase)/N-methyltransferase